MLKDMVRILILALVMVVSVPVANSNAAPHSFQKGYNFKSLSSATIQKLIGLASIEWQVSVEFLSDEHELGDLTITEQEPGHYFIDSVSHGGLLIILEENM